MTRLVVLVSIVCFAASLSAEPIRIDLNQDNGRRNAETWEWEQWPLAKGNALTHDFGDVAVTLHSETPIDAFFRKAGLDTGATLASDGAGAARSLRIELRGLTPGTHTLATYHNGVEEANPSPIQIWLGDEKITEVTPSHRVANDADVASAHMSFLVDQGDTIQFRLTSSNGPVLLNGLAIDTPDPSAQARQPEPPHGDWHTDGDSGFVPLSWRRAPGATSHLVYFCTNGSPETPNEKPLEKATPDKAYLIVDTTETMIRVPIERHNSLNTYSWRVDSVDASGKVTRGDMWRFRVRHLAFPEAEGYGRFALGGRGGRVFTVTNLLDRGPGSLREAVEAEGPRTVVFNVSGLISLESKLVFRNPFLTVAGQTAPGKGICIRNYTFGGLGATDCIIRHVRVRLGDLAGITMDGMGLASCDHCIIDHASISWTIDEAFSSRGAKNITLQRSLISEALNDAKHKKYEPGKRHGFAASIGGMVGSFHHNLLAHCAGRNWSLAGGLNQSARHTGALDIRNNVVYNWEHRTTDGGAAQVQFVGNYYKPGPASRVFHLLMPERNPSFGPQDYYVEGNVMEGHYTANERYAGVNEREGPLSDYMKDTPFFPSFILTETANEAYASVLADVGCNLPMLDEHDQRVIHETRTGETTYQASKTGLPGIPDSQKDVGSWERYPEEHRPAEWDTDGDGMPDAWEAARGSDPKRIDGHLDDDRDGYTRLEEYLNALASRRE